MNRGAEDYLRRHRAITLTALALLGLLAWACLITGAGTGMAAHAEFTLFPAHSDTMQMPTGWHAGRVVITLAMWWLMMIAMMVPAAAPVVLLHARAAAAHGLKPHSGSFVAGYLLVWLLFSGAAAGLQAALETVGVLPSMDLALTGKWLASGALIAAGLYQLSPAKSACLSHCRNPADFLARNFRHGRAGALRMGIVHGAFCVGCCWMLMALLFVVGIMNLAWIAVLTLIVGVEKLIPYGAWIGRAGGAALIAWGVICLLG